MSTNTIKRGDTFRSLVADANVLWRVTRINGQVVTAIGVNEPYDIGGTEYPSECAGEERDFLRSEVAAKIARATALDNFVQSANDEAAAFWNSVTVGDRLHYRTSGNAWVRGTVVIDANGGKAFLPTALVGDGWRQHDIYTVDMTGTVSHGYHGRKVMESEVWLPQHRDIYESDPSGDLDPRTLPERSLVPPKPTPEQETEYAKGGQVQAIRKAAEDYTLSVDERLDRIREILGSGQ